MMRLKVALRFIIRKPIQALITLLVIASGVGVFYFVLNAGTSLKNSVFSTTAEANSHILISDMIAFESYEDPEVSAFRDELFMNDKRIVDIGYSLNLPISYTDVNGTTNDIMIKGIDFFYSANIQQISDRILIYPYNSIPETSETSEYAGEIVIGQGIADLLGLGEGVSVIGNIIPFNLLGIPVSFKVVGVHRSDQILLNEKLIYTTIETTQKLSQLKLVNAIEIRTQNPLQSTEVLTKIAPIIEKHYPNASYSEWQNGNRYVVNALYIEDISIAIIQLFTALAIAFGVAMLVSFMVRAKITQLGVLKALGLNNNDISMIFFYYVLLLTIVGVIAGIFLGSGLTLAFGKIFTRPNGMPLIALSGKLINSYSLTSVFVIFTGSILSCVPSIIYARKLKIIEVIKNE